MKKKNWKRVLVLMLSMVMISGLMACSGPKKDDAGEKNEGKAESKDVSFTFMDTMPSPEREKFYKDAIERYESENPGVKVEYTSVPWDEAYKKLVAMSASKTLPDILTGDTAITTALAGNGGLADLTDRFKAMPSYSDLNAAALASEITYSYKGKIYAIPDGFLSQGIFVRTDWLEKAGYKVEDLKNWTWDDYDEVVAKLTNADEGKFGMAFRGGNNGTLRLYEYFASQLEVTDMFPYGDNRSIFEDDRALELFENFYGHYTNGESPKDSINWGFKEQVDGFVSGQCGTLNQTPEVIKTCEDSMEEGTWTVLPQPVKKDAKIHSYMWGASGSYMLSADSKVQDAAWKFIEWLSSPEMNTEYAKAFSCSPLYNSAMKDPFFSEGYMNAYATQVSDSKVAYLAQPTWLSQWGYFLSEFGKVETQKYMSGEQTAQQTLDNLSKWLRDNYDADIANKVD